MLSGCGEDRCPSDSQGHPGEGECNRPGNRGTWASEVTRDLFAGRDGTGRPEGHLLQPPLGGSCGGSWETWSGPVGPTAVLCTCTILPSLISFTCRSWGGAFSRGLGYPGDRLYREKPEAPSSHSARPCPPHSRGSWPGPEGPGQSVLGAEAGGSGKAFGEWTQAEGMLKDQQVFSGQGHHPGPCGSEALPSSLATPVCLQEVSARC